MILLSILCVISHLICGRNLNWLLNLYLIYETLWTGIGSGLFIFGIDVKMDGSVFEEKSSFKILGLTFSSKLDWSTYFISIAKTASKKIGALIHSMKLISLEVALYLFFLKLGFTPCKPKQPLQGMQFQEKEAQKD